MVDPVDLDERQLEAVRLTDTHTLVAAGAGTGKTSTVVGRILYLLGVPLGGRRIPEPVAFDRIAAITFTNAAAADLKRKVREALVKAGRSGEAFQVDTARIGTIHSFAGDVLREFALRSGRSTAFTILEEGESADLAHEVVRDTLISAVAEQNLEGLDRLLEAAGIDAVCQWVRRLIADTGRLAELRRREQGARERTLLSLAERAGAALGARLEASGATDFDRMLQWACDLVRDPAIARALQRRLHTLIVDEFQDVDPVQRDLVYLIGEPASRSAATPRLILVGDPKQSIYRFRRADVTVWRAVERDFRASGLGAVVTLEKNYRSVAPVLAFVDAVIGPILDRPLGADGLADYEVPFTPVAPTRDTGPPDRAVELMLPPAQGGKGEEKLLVGARRQAEAEQVALRASQLRQERGRWGGMAVLLGAWSDVKLYESALAAVGAPTFTLYRDGFYQRQEIADVLVALEAIRDPRNDVALFGFLRGPWVGVRDETLFALALAGPPPRWDRLRTLETRERALLDRGIGLLDEFRVLRDRIPTAELLERLLQDSGYLAHLALLGEEARQRVANLRKLVRMARGMAHASLGDFLRVLREARVNRDREGDARLFGETDDVVTITSIHSAKGLQWDVVFWADTERGGGQDRSDGLVVSRERLLIADEEAPEAAQIQAEAAQELAAERKRVWYVAATRARDRLIVSGLALDKPAKGSAAEAMAPLIRPMLAPDGGTFSYTGRSGNYSGAVHRIAAPARAAAPASPAAELRPASELSRPYAPIRVAAGALRHSATEFLAWERCPLRHHYRYVAGVREPAVTVAEGTREQAIRVGQIVHDVLERLHEEAELELVLEEAIGRWDPGALPPDSVDGAAYRDRIRAEIEGVRGHPGYRALAERPGAEHELPFVRVASDGSRLEGRIDLAAPDGDGLVLLDVKTGGGGGSSPAERARRYAIQRDVYLTVAEAISGLPVRRFVWQFSRDGAQVEEPVTESLRAEARERVHAMTGGIHHAAPALTSHPAECRFCGFREVGWCAGVP